MYQGNQKGLRAQCSLLGKESEVRLICECLAGFTGERKEDRESESESMREREKGRGRESKRQAERQRHTQRKSLICVKEIETQRDRDRDTERVFTCIQLSKCACARGQL